ncbi:Tartrate-resistant acid phosphatase type 5 [Chytriomyces hyalinus]|nr:Tartrate-resistant acid phosphatase type 5 [Chytriomyces hyalinus]
MIHLLTAAFLCTLTMASTLPPSLSFLVVGDWGNEADVTDMRGVARAMNDWASEHKSNAVISLGDNFYKGGSYDYEGVLSKDDKKFTSLWSDVFNGPALRALPWWITMGNHDWYAQGSSGHQLDFEHENWHFPDLFYSKRVPLGFSDMYASFIFIETDLLQYGYGALAKNDSQMAGNFETFGWVEAAQTVEKQLAWLDKALETANQDALVFVVGHHGGFACSFDVVQAVYMDRVVALINKWNVSSYIHGHHHTMAYYYTNNGATLHVQAGSGGNVDAACAPIDTTAKGEELPNTYGFVHLSISGRDGAVFEFVTEIGEVVFEAKVGLRTPVEGVFADTTHLPDAEDPSVHYKKSA